jgi:hypothetical protein
MYNQDVTKIFRLIDIIDDDKTGVLVDMEYTEDEESIDINSLSIHNIIEGVVGPVLEEVPVVVTAAFCESIINILNNADD